MSKPASPWPLDIKFQEPEVTFDVPKVEMRTAPKAVVLDGGAVKTAPRAVRSDGKTHLAGDTGDGAANFEKLVDKFVQTQPKISRAKA